jgi:hypothetical protein
MLKPVSGQFFPSFSPAMTGILSVTYNFGLHQIELQYYLFELFLLSFIFIVIRFLFTIGYDLRRLNLQGGSWAGGEGKSSQ